MNVVYVYARARFRSWQGVISQTVYQICIIYLRHLPPPLFTGRERERGTDDRQTGGFVRMSARLPLVIEVSCVYLPGRGRTEGEQ